MTHVQQLPDRLSAESLGRLQLRLRSVLRPTRAVRIAEQTASGGDVGSNRPIQKSTSPGRDLGVRAPYPAETALKGDR